MIKTISTYTTPIEAHIAKGRLEAEGIPAYIADEHYIAALLTVSLTIGGVRLQVPASLASQAKDIINKLELGSYAEPMFEEDIEAEATHCPKCYAIDTSRVNWIWKLAFAFMFLSIFPLPYSKHRFKCNVCRNSWIAKDHRGYPVILILSVSLFIAIVVTSILLLLYYWRCKYIYCPL